MARKSKRGQGQQNWDFTPDDLVEPTLELGDTVEVTRDLFLYKDPISEDVTHATTTSPVYGDKTHRGRLEVNSHSIGIYVGTQYVKRQIMLKTGDFWADRKKYDNIQELKHIFVFNGQKLAIEPQHVRKIV